MPRLRIALALALACAAAGVRAEEPFRRLPAVE